MAVVVEDLLEGATLPSGCHLKANLNGQLPDNKRVSWREVRSAKPLFGGSNPPVASNTPQHHQLRRSTISHYISIS
jgi:hypothetical protein